MNVINAARKVISHVNAPMVVAAAVLVAAVVVAASNAGKLDISVVNAQILAVAAAVVDVLAINVGKRVISAGIVLEMLIAIQAEALVEMKTLVETMEVSTGPQVNLPILNPNMTHLTVKKAAVMVVEMIELATSVVKPDILVETALVPQLVHVSIAIKKVMLAVIVLKNAN